MKKEFTNTNNINLHRYLADYYLEGNLIDTKTIIALNDEDARLKAQFQNDNDYEIRLLNIDANERLVSENVNLFEENTLQSTVPTWIVTFYLPSKETEVDDEFADDVTKKTVKVSANSKDDAEKYCQQYIRIKQQDSDAWNNAEIESIEAFEN